MTDKQSRSDLSVIIMTHDSAQIIGRTLKAAFEVSDDIHVIDSFSEDNTVEVLRAAGCNVTERAFNGYADQRNWAMANLNIRGRWQLHLDADEELDAKLIEAINNIDFGNTKYDGFLIARRIVFMGKILRFGGGIARTWHCRVFKNGFGQCEERLYDNHFVCRGKVSMLPGSVLDHQENSISEWTKRHNYWSDVEVCEITLPSSADTERVLVEPSLRGNPIERKRYFKNRYYRMPLFFRSFGYFMYRYFFRAGFLDGVEGLIFHFLQGFWFRFLVDAKLYEARWKQKAKNNA